MTQISGVAPVPELPVIARAREHAWRTALVGPDGRCRYADLLEASTRVAATLLDGADDLREARVAFLASPGWHYVAVQWGVWRAGGIAVPLAVSHPPPEVEHVIRDADAAVVLGHGEWAELLPALAHEARARYVDARVAAEGSAPRSLLPVVDERRRAMIIYTSGTTGRPKGAVLTHANLRAQVTSLVTAWAWRPDDRILLVLPLHHVHGIVNVVTCALWSGATCEVLPRFDARAAWMHIARGGLTLFMAVPTVYRRLIAAWEEATAPERRAWSAAAGSMRLMVSGSAALPVRTLERWREITGHTLLERYGMTEIGMALSNPVAGERRPGFVGGPLPGVAVRLVDDAGRVVPAGAPGELEVRGDTVFLEYWRRPEETRQAFHDGWFRTGDVAVHEDGAYRMLGRSSVDIIKTGGYKVSALEVEETLREHPAVAECAVIGVADADWGERVCAAVEVHAGAELTLDGLQRWAKERLAPYKVPREVRVVAALPRNALGKVTKPEVARLFRG
jgi:malonyl-CoA/methylmalonyl-CoA synthetase